MRINYFTCTNYSILISVSHFIENSQKKYSTKSYRGALKSPLNASSTVYYCTLLLCLSTKLGAKVLCCETSRTFSCESQSPFTTKASLSPVLVGGRLEYDESTCGQEYVKETMAMREKHPANSSPSFQRLPLTNAFPTTLSSISNRTSTRASINH